MPPKRKMTGAGPRRKMTVAGPRRMSTRLKERFQGVRSVPIDSEPIDLGMSESEITPPSSPDLVAQEIPEQEPLDATVQSQTEQQPPVDETHRNTPSPITENQENTAVPIAETPYSNPRFANKQAEERYTTGYAKRPVLCERGIQLEDYVGPPYELKEMIDRRGWNEWVSISQKAVVPLVKEFYSNAVKGDSRRKEIHTEVRKKPIILTPEMIAQVCAIPSTNIPVATSQQQAEWKEQLSKDNLAKLLTGNPQAQWGKARMSRADLTDKSRILHLLVCSKLLPHAYVTTITVAQAEFVGRLLLDIPIDLPNHIWTIIATAVEKSDVNSGLPFGGLITKIIQNHRIKGKAGMDMIKPAARIAKTSIKRSQGQLARKAVAESSSAQQPQREEVAEEVTLQSLFAMIKGIQQKQDDFIAEMRSWKTKQEESNDQIIEMLSGMYDPADPKDFTPADQ